MDKVTILGFLDKVIDVAQAAGPIATMLGIPFVEKITQFADTALDIGKNVLERAEEANIVLSSQDVDDINVRLAQLETINADLHAKILAS